MSLKTCAVGGTVDDGGIVLNGSGATVVSPTDNAPLADEHDDTYISNTSTSALDYMVRINALTSWDSGDPIRLHLRWSIESDDHTGSAANMFLFLQWMDPDDLSGDNLVGQFGSSWNTEYHIAAVMDGTVYDSVIPFVTRPPGTGGGTGVLGSTLDEVLAVLTTGDCWLDVNVVAPLDGSWSSMEARLIEAYLTVGTRVLRLPNKRVFPRSDQRRVWPPPSSRQAGRRTGPSSIL